MIERIAAFGRPQATISEEAYAEKTANETAEFIELSSKGESSLGGSQDIPIFIAFFPFMIQDLYH